MAKIKSAGLRNYVGRLGGNVYYVAGGQNIGRELAPSVANPRTKSQMRQRMRWANIVNMYKANKDWMGRLSFENKPQNWSYYNAFMSANLFQASPIYLTKDIAETGGVILAPYVMTQGTLPVITLLHEVSVSGFLTNIKAPNYGETVGSLATSILENNPMWQRGDQLSLIVMLRDRMYRPMVYPIEIILDPTDNTALTDIGTPYATLIDMFDIEEGYLAINMETGQSSDIYALCAVHSRTVSGKTYVSTQSFVLSPYADLEATNATTDEAFENAYESYGTTEDYFLATDEYNTLVGQGIRGVVYDGTGAANYGAIGWQTGTAPHTLVVVMNKIPLGNVVLRVATEIVAATIIGKQLHATISAQLAQTAAEAPDGNRYIEVTSGSEVYQWR
jgi:hypothetical protein